jgi:hypothetical protein
MSKPKVHASMPPNIRAVIAQLIGFLFIAASGLPSGAKARVLNLALAARLKLCPFKTSTITAAIATYN